ncbi:hypothetical protein AGMMS49944_01040 [Spirochaetia bacterium]|nr:hypothetical protein AGMMS49944_01040 [Spirochaetia bacterium]
MFMDNFAFVYSLGFIFLFLLPVIIFFRRIRITKELKDLTGLSLEPEYSPDANTLIVKNNAAEFANSLDKKMKKNHILKILNRICKDAENGKIANKEFYLFLYKSLQNKFLANIFLASFIVPAILLIAQLNNSGISNVELLFTVQFIWYVLIAALKRVLEGNYEAFAEHFYINWYEMILNLDSIVINAISLKLSEETNSTSIVLLNNTIANLQNVYSQQSENLAKSNETLAQKLENLTASRMNGEIVSIENIIQALDKNNGSIETLYKNLNNIALSMEEWKKSMPKLTATNSINIEAMNKLSDGLNQFRHSIIEQSNCTEKEVAHILGNITTDLQNNVNRTFTNIEETLTKNAAELSKSYERFFEICKILSENLSKKEP